MSKNLYLYSQLFVHCNIVFRMVITCKVVFHFEVSFLICRFFFLLSQNHIHVTPHCYIYWKPLTVLSESNTALHSNKHDKTSHIFFFVLFSFTSWLWGGDEVFMGSKAGKSWQIDNVCKLTLELLSHTSGEHVHESPQSVSNPR